MNSTENRDDDYLPLKDAAEPEIKDERLKGVVYANLTALLNTGFLTGTKILQTNGMETMHCAFARNFICGIGAFALMLKLGIHPTKSVDKFELKRDLILRIIIGTVAFNISIYTSSIIPLSVFHLLDQTANFWSSIIGYYLFNDHLTIYEISANLIGLVGLCLIVFCNESEDQQASDKFLFGTILTAFNSLLVALVQVLTRRMQRLHNTVILVHYCFASCLIMLIYIILDYSLMFTPRQIYEGNQWALLSLSACFGAAGNFTWNAAYQATKAGIISPIQFSGVFYNFLLDLFLFQYRFTYLQIVGGIITISMNFLISFQKC